MKSPHQIIAISALCVLASAAQAEPAKTSSRYDEQKESIAMKRFFEILRSDKKAAAAYHKFAKETDKIPGIDEKLTTEAQGKAIIKRLSESQDPDLKALAEIEIIAISVRIKMPPTSEERAAIDACNKAVGSHAEPDAASAKIVDNYLRRVNAAIDAAYLAQKNPTKA